MKKILGILVILFLVTGCKAKKDIYYYKDMSNTIISLFKDINYDKSSYSKEENDAINKIVSELTHENHKINVSNFIEKSEEYKVYESNSPEIIKENNECYIYYKDLGYEQYEKNENHYEMEAHKRLVCDGYYTILYSSYFYPKYELTQNNPEHDYIFLDFNETKNGYNYVYKSSYNGEYLVVDINTKNMEIKLLNTLTEEEIIVEEKNESNTFDIIIAIILIIISFVAVFVLMKNKKKNEY